ncbi:MerR family transcriptional regulator [Actinomadura sp. 9N407]|uniref:MerR family transcriptional regulator n=1 Tax=Actinomadura sp. 9N407 TaxID=3375154 RepID=UPI0037A6FDE4
MRVDSGDHSDMRIGELSRRTGASVRSLRYYEEQGLLAPERQASGYREYRDEDAVTVRGIRLMLAAGLNTTTIAELLPCMIDDGQGLTPGCLGLVPDLRRERERLTAAMDELMAARDTLDTIIGAPVPSAGAVPSVGAVLSEGAVPSAGVVPSTGDEETCEVGRP